MMKDIKSQQPESGQAQRVWNLLTGVYDLDTYVPPEAKYVCNEWEDDVECDALWQAIYDACARLAQRFGDGEDPDLHIIAENYERLMKLSGLKMFEYGRTLPRPTADHSIGAYADRQRERQENRITAAQGRLRARYGIEPGSPELRELTGAYREMIAQTEAAAYAQGTARGMENEKKPPASLA